MGWFSIEIYLHGPYMTAVSVCFGFNKLSTIIIVALAWILASLFCYVRPQECQTTSARRLHLHWMGDGHCICPK